MNKRADFVMPSWLGKMIIALIAFGLIAVLILVVVGPPAEQVVGSDIIYRLQTLSFGDRGVTGAIGDPAKAVCFGTGTSKSVICLDKGNGNEIFNAKLLIKGGYAMSKPALVSDGIILGFGKFVCKYDQTGSEQWCQTFTDPITSGIAVDEDVNVTCFETGKFPDAGGQTTCLDAKTGEFKFSVLSTEKMASTPAIDKSKNAVYFAAGAYVYKYGLGNEGLIQAPKSEVWATNKYDHAILSDIVLGNGLVCFDSSPKAHCVSESTGADYFNITVDASAKKTRDDFVAVENQTDFKLTQWGIDESSIKVNIFHSLGESGYSENTFNCVGGMHASCTFDPSTRVATLSEFDKASAGDLVNISYTFGGNLGCSSDDSQRAVSTPAIYGDSIYFDLCSSLCKYNITNSTGSKENCKDSTWVATDTFSKPLYSGVTAGIVPPIPESTFNDTTMVCTGSGQDQKIACFFDDGNSTTPFISIEGKWNDCPRVAADSLRYTKDWDLKPIEYFSVDFGDSTCFADSTPALSKEMLYYALGNRVCATNLTSMSAHGELTLDEKSSSPTGGIAKWCKPEGSSELLVTGSYTWIPSVTDLAIYEPPLKFVAGTPGVVG